MAGPQPSKLMIWVRIPVDAHDFYEVQAKTKEKGGEQRDSKRENSYSKKND